MATKKLNSKKSSEYSKARKAAQQRITRIKKAGFAKKVKDLPSIADLKKLKNPDKALKRALDRAKKIIADPDYTVAGQKKKQAAKQQQRKIQQQKYRQSKKFYKGLNREDRGLYNAAKKLGIPSALTPEGFEKFKDYVKTREAQADYSKKYKIADYGEEFEELIDGGYDPVEVASDFDGFLNDALKMDAEMSGISGYSSADVDLLFDRYRSGL